MQPQQVFQLLPPRALDAKMLAVRRRAVEEICSRMAIAWAPCTAKGCTYPAGHPGPHSHEE